MHSFAGLATQKDNIKTDSRGVRCVKQREFREGRDELSVLYEQRTS
jgi:hypothetical protein